MMKYSTAILFTAALTAASAAGPVLTEADWLAAGDGLLTTDAISGLQWLDWEYTINRSYDDVSSQLGAGGEFEGFRYATYAEVFDLYDHAGVVSIGEPSTHDTANNPALLFLADLLGTTFATGAEAIYDHAHTAGNHMVTAFNFNDGHSAMEWFELVDSSAFFAAGSALVRVPAPGSVALLGIGGLIASRRHRTN